MANFAELGLDNIVQRVISVNNDTLLDSNNIEQESKGIAFCKNLFGGTWIQTSYNNNFRKNYAGIGYTYDSKKDMFIPIKPYASWELDETDGKWKNPIPIPIDDNIYIWDEPTLSWKIGDMN